MSKQTKAQLLVEISALQTQLERMQEIQAESPLKNASHDPGERVKELKYSYSISNLIRTPRISLAEILQRSVNLLPPAWQYPQITCARILLEDTEYKTDNFCETKWKLASKIREGDRQIGSVEVYFLEERPEKYEGPFLKKERTLINEVADYLSYVFEHNQVEKMLREKEELFRLMFMQHDAIMLLIEPKTGRIVDANNKAAEFYGYSRSKLISMKIQEINCLPEEEVERRRIQALKEKKNYFIFEHKLANGEVRIVEVHSSPITIGSQDILFSIIHDITAKKIAEDTIKKQNSFFNAIMDNSLIAMWVSDAQGTIIRVNSSLLKMLNLSEQVIVGKYNVLKDLNLVKQKVMPKVEAVFKDKEPARFVIWWTGDATGLSNFKSANSIWIDVSMYPVVDADNNLLNVVCQWVDITHLKQTEEEIRSLSKFPDENPSPVLRFSKKGKILYASKSSEALLRKWGKTIGKNVPPDWEKNISKSFTSDVTQEIETICEGRTLSFILTPIKEMGYVNAYGRDVTEKKKVERELQENQKRYEKAQAMGKVGNWEYDPVTNNFWGSDEAKRIYGFNMDQEKFTTENVESCIPERERVHQALIDLIEHNKNYDLTFDILTFNKGIRKTIHSIAEVERDAQGNLVKVTGVISDITKQHKAERALLESEKRHRTYIEDAPIGIFIVNDKGEYVDVNPSACKLLDYTRDELLRLSIPDISSKEDSQNSFKLLKKEGKRSFEAGLIKKDGSIVTVRLDAVSIPNNQFIAFATDITDRKEFTRELQRERDKAQKYLDIAEVMIVALNAMGEVILINRKGTKVLGYQEDELLGKNWHDTCLPKQTIKSTKQKFKELMAGEEGLGDEFEQLVLTKSGEERIIAWHNTLLLDEDGHCLGTLSSGDDITERVRTEQLLKALNKASIAMGNALTHSEIFYAIANELKQLGISCYILGTDEKQEKVSFKYLSYDSASLKAVEKFAGIKSENYSISIDAIDFIKEVIREKKTFYSDKTEQVVRQMIPKLGRKFSSQIVKKLNIQTSISAPLIEDDRAIGLFSIQSKHLILEDVPAATAFADQLSSAWKKVELLQNLTTAVEGTIHTLAATTEVRDPYTAGHQKRVTELAVTIATTMGLDSGQIEGIRMAGTIHDLGKVRVPAEILSKPGKITDLEYEMIKTHPQVGYDLLKGIDFPWPLAQIVLQHHERIDGSGYPQGLKGDEIMIEAKILAVADVVEAMASHRPYRPALGIEKALGQIKKDRGILFDPEIVDACLKGFEKGFKFTTTVEEVNTIPI